MNVTGSYDLDAPAECIWPLIFDPATLRAEYDAQLLVGVEVLRAVTTSNQPLTFIPYQLWANRGESQMTVWVNV